MMKRAHYLVRENGYMGMTFSKALKQVWAEMKAFKVKMLEEWKLEVAKVRSMWDVAVNTDINAEIQGAFNRGSRILGYED